MASKLKLAGDFDFKELAKMTPGYVGADLNALTAAAGVVALKRIFQEIGNVDKIMEEEVLEGVTNELVMSNTTTETTSPMAVATTKTTATMVTDIQKHDHRHKPVHSISAFLQLSLIHI